MITRQTVSGRTMHLATMAAFCLLILVSTSPAQIAVIVNTSVPITSADGPSILDIYSLTTMEWPDGTPIIVVALKGNDEAIQRFYQYIGKRPLELKKRWMRAQLSGEGRVPVILNSEPDVVAKVASTPGAIGFVREVHVDSTVKTVAIIQ